EVLKNEDRPFRTWERCRSTAKLTSIIAPSGLKMFFDNRCESGRMLLSSAKLTSNYNFFCGVETRPICAKITAINLLLNNLQYAEILLLDENNAYEFVEAYSIKSRSKKGIDTVYEKENSLAWDMYKASKNL